MYITITDEQVDAKSPINETLMTTIKDNFDDHEVRLQSADTPQGQGNTGFTVVMAASAATVTLLQKDATTSLSADEPAVIAFRDSTITTGAYEFITITSDLSVVIPSGATMGTTNGDISRVYIYAINNAGTVELAVSQQLFTEQESEFISTTAISAAADSGTVLYSTSARTDVPFRCIGHFESTQATAGTWATSPTEIYVGVKKIQDYDLSSSSVLFTTTSSSPVAVTNLTVTITTNGRPVYMSLVGDGTGGASFVEGSSSSVVTGIADIYFYRDGAEIAEYDAGITTTGTGGSGGASRNAPGSFNHVDIVAPGTYTYTVYASNNITNGTTKVTSCKLLAYEI